MLVNNVYLSANKNKIISKHTPHLSSHCSPVKMSTVTNIVKKAKMSRKRATFMFPNHPGPPWNAFITTALKYLVGVCGFWPGVM